MTNLDIYYSAACQLNCPYCAVKQRQNNDRIQTLLQEGWFALRVNDKITQDTISLGIWGLEPTLNAMYFKSFIYPILDKWPQIKYINYPTNLQEDIYYLVIKPLNDYAFDNKRKLILQVQVSLDGPRSIHDMHCGVGSFDRVVTNINTICRQQQENKYFRVKVFNKSTLTARDLYTDPEDWWEIMAFFQSGWEDYENYSLQVKMDNPPTVAVPGNYTAQDGKELVKWDLNFDTKNYHTCAAGTTSKTIDYTGALYDCHLLCNKEGILEQNIRRDFDIKVDELLKSGEITETNREALWNAISNIYCWATGNGGMPESYIKLLGNGALKGD